MAAQLNGYSEQGPSAELLTFATTKFHSVAGTVGFRRLNLIPMQPAWADADRARAGCQGHRLLAPARAGTHTTSARVWSPQWRRRKPPTARSTPALDFRARMGNGFGGEVEYGTSAGGGKVQSQTVRAALKAVFESCRQSCRSLI